MSEPIASTSKATGISASVDPVGPPGTIFSNVATMGNAILNPTQVKAPITSDTFPNSTLNGVLDTMFQPTIENPAEIIGGSEAAEAATTAAVAASSFPILPAMFALSATGNLASSVATSNQIHSLQSGVLSQGMNTQLGSNYLSQLNYTRGMASIEASRGVMDSASILGPLNLLFQGSTPNMLTPNTQGYVYDGMNLSDVTTN